MTLSRMIFLSTVFHGLLFLTVVLSSFAWPQREFTPVIHHVELVKLPHGDIQQLKTIPEQRPKRVKQELDEREMVPVEKKPILNKEAEKEKLPIQDDLSSTDLKQEEPEKQASVQMPGVPEVMPVLRKSYSEYAFYHALIGREIRKRWSPPSGFPG